MDLKANRYSMVARLAPDSFLLAGEQVVHCSKVSRKQVMKGLLRGLLDVAPHSPVLASTSQTSSPSSLSVPSSSSSSSSAPSSHSSSPAASRAATTTSASTSTSASSSSLDEQSISSDTVTNGTLVVTNFRLVFLCDEPSVTLLHQQKKLHPVKDVTVALGAIFRVQKKRKTRTIRLFCKDIRKLEFLLLENDSMAKKRLDKIYETIRIYAFPGITKNLFAFDFELPDVAILEQALLKLNVDYSHLLSSSSSSSSTTTPGQQDYVRDDLARLGVPNDKWRLCDVNSNYAISDTYPSLFAVPASVSDNVIIEAATFRSKGRLPILSWIHPSNFATITRSSQPLVGMKNHRSKADEKLIRNIATSNPTSRSLCILDARPKVNAAANKAKGAGYEHASTYNNSNHTASDCQEELSNIKEEVLPAGAKQMVSAVEFLGIDNIHVMRESERKLRELCVNSSSEDRGWFSDLENTRWLDHINLLLVCTKKIVENIQNGVSVFVHCSDGWDRTSQLTSLAMLCLDPYYRTMEGFATLIEREWLATGHKFSQRYGHGNKDYEDKDRAPIFPQFIDCVWQLQHQFPTLFEFNENYLLKVLDGMYSCQFGTFLYNCEKERRQAKVREQTVSLWQMIQLENKYNLLANSIEANGGMNKVSNSPYMFLLDSYNFNNNNHHNFYFNEHYDRTQSGQVVSTPMVGLKNVKLWNSYFLRFCQNVRGINSSFLSSGEHSASATSGQGPSLQTIRNIRASQSPSAFAVPSVLSPRDKITASAFASHRLSKEVSSMNNVEELKALVRTLQEEHEESIQLITQRADASIELLKKQKNETLQKYLLMNSFIAEERKKIKFLRSLLDKHGISFSKEDFQSWTQENEDGVDCDEEEGDWFDFIGSVEEEEDEETDETDEETDTGNDTEDEIISQVRRRKREMTVIRRELELSRNRKASPPDDYAELLGGVDDVGSGSGGSGINPTAQWQGGKVDSPRTSSSGVATKKSKPPLFVAGAMNHGNAAERVELSLRRQAHSPTTSTKTNSSPPPTTTGTWLGVGVDPRTKRYSTDLGSSSLASSGEHQLNAEGGAFKAPPRKPPPRPPANGTSEGEGGGASVPVVPAPSAKRKPPAPPRPKKGNPV